VQFRSAPRPHFRCVRTQSSYRRSGERGRISIEKIWLWDYPENVLIYLSVYLFIIVFMNSNQNRNQKVKFAEKNAIEMLMYIAYTSTGRPLRIICIIGGYIIDKNRIGNTLWEKLRIMKKNLVPRFLGEGTFFAHLTWLRITIGITFSCWERSVFPKLCQWQLARESRTLRISIHHWWFARLTAAC